MIRRAGVVGFFTLLSRITGLVRDVAIAYAFGAHVAADAFFVAFRIPNLFRRLFAEGALTVSVVPVFTESTRGSRDEARRIVDTACSFLLVALVGLSILGVLFAPLLVRLIAWGFARDADKFSLTVDLTRVMFPYILLVSIAAFFMGILNALKHFAAPAAAPILLNLAIILGALVLAGWTDPPVLGLALGVLIGGICQVAIQLPVIKKTGFWPRWRWNPRHPALKRIVGMMVPAAYGAAVYQFNVVIITLLASFLPSGSVSYLWYADRIVEFPIGVFAIAMATALLPSLSDYAADQKMNEFRVVFRQALRSTFFIIVPSTVGLIVLARPIVSVLFERGSFDSVTAAESASTLVFYALGLPFISGVRIVSNAFFSLKDMHTPVRCANVSVIVNIVAALLLMGPMRHEGLALAVSLSACANFLLQIRALRKKLGPLGLRSVGRDLARSVVASLVMSGVVWWLGSQGSGPMGVAVQITAGASTYLLTAWVLRSPEAVQIGSRLTSLFRGGGRRDGLQ